MRLNVNYFVIKVDFDSDNNKKRDKSL